MTGESNLRYLQVKHELLTEIKTLPEHVRIPSRNELVKKYQAARTTVDRAISELIGEGYLYSRDGSGTYVAPAPETSLPVTASPNLTWGVILPNIMRDTYPGILRGVGDLANSNGINVVICNTDNLIAEQTQHIQKLIAAGVQGLVIVPAIIGENDLTPFKRLEERGIPFVFANRGVSGVEAPAVISNNFYGGYLATKHLIGRGYQRIAYVSRPQYSTSLERYQGYLSALAEAGIEVDENYVVFEESFEIHHRGYESTKRLLKRNPLPDAIFAFNDGVAEGAYQAIAETGLRVGQDIGLIGYDNTHSCDRFPVKLSSVQFQTYEIGSKAAELLFEILQGEKIPKNKTIILKPELVARESCNRLAISLNDQVV